MTTCKKCNQEITQNYCPNCGQSVNLKRIDSHYFQHEIEHFFHVERGIFFTAKELLIRPGERIREFLTEDRSRLVKPLIFIILTSLIFTLLGKVIHADTQFIKIGGPKDSTNYVINEWIKSNFGYSNLLYGLFVAFFIKLLFRKHNYSFFEILVLFCFITGEMLLLFALIFLIAKALPSNFLQNTQTILAIIPFVYATWAIGQFFDKFKVISYIKAAIGYLLGFLTFPLLIALLGALIDKIK
jgi:hypothetical protein